MDTRYKRKHGSSLGDILIGSSTRRNKVIVFKDDAVKLVAGFGVVDHS